MVDDDHRYGGRLEQAPGRLVKRLAERIAAVRDLVLRSSRAWTTEDVAKSFKRAKRADVEAVLESLAALGLVLAYNLPDGPRWRTPSRTAA